MTSTQSKLRQKLFVLLLVVGGTGIAAFALVVMLADRQIFENFIPENRALREVETRSAVLIQNYLRIMLTPGKIDKEALDGELQQIRSELDKYSQLVSGQGSKERLKDELYKAINHLEFAGRELFQVRSESVRIKLQHQEFKRDINSLFAQYQVLVDATISSSTISQDQQVLRQMAFSEYQSIHQVKYLFLQLLLTMEEYQASPEEGLTSQIEFLQKDILAAILTLENYTISDGDRVQLSSAVMRLYENMLAVTDDLKQNWQRAVGAIAGAEQLRTDINGSIMRAITAHDLAAWRELRTTLILSGGVLLMTLVVAYLLIYIGLDRILRPLEMLQAVISRLGEGDFKQRSKDVQRSDEIGQLAGAFNRMADQLEQNVVQQQLFIEQLEEKNIELERFTYTVSHELKSPLVTVSGFIGHLERDLNENNRDKVNSDLNRIRHAIGVMGKQLEDLLDLSRVGRVVRPATSFSFTELCQEVLSLMQGLIDERDALIEIEDNRFEIFADKARIREVVKNLVENGIKFAPLNQKPRIKIKASKTKDKILCRIEDNGPGIDPCYQDRVFGLFDRLETSIPGTGIGLALVKRIVEIHNGDIWIESQGNGQGCCFCFTLPYPGGS